MYKTHNSFNISKNNPTMNDSMQQSLAKNLSNRNLNQSPKMLSPKINNLNQDNKHPNSNPNTITNINNITNNNNNNKNNKNTKAETFNSQSKQLSLLDVKMKTYKQKTCFNKQFGRPQLTVSQVFTNLNKNKNKLQSNSEKEETIESLNKMVQSQNNWRDIKTADPNLNPRMSLFNHPAFQREHHNHGPTPRSNDFINIALAETNRQLYMSCAEPKVNPKEMALKYRESDVFHQKEVRVKQPKRIFSAVEPTSSNKLDIKIDYYDSDIFCLKNNKTSLSKSTEKQIALVSPKKYHRTTMSGSEWYPKTAKSTLVNYESSNLNICNMGVKGFSKTREMIETEDPTSCANKKKSLNEYVDLIRPFAPNPNIQYLKALNNNKDEFKVHNDVCANYGNLYQAYKGISEPPFLR